MLKTTLRTPKIVTAVAFVLVAFIEIARFRSEYEPLCDALLAVFGGAVLIYYTLTVPVGSSRMLSSADITPHSPPSKSTSLRGNPRCWQAVFQVSVASRLGVSIINGLSVGG